MGFIDNRARRVIPNWREFNRTAKQGELSSFREIKDAYDISYITPYLSAWERNKTIGYAADLLNAAYIINIFVHPFITDAANLILAHKEDSSRELNKLAHFFVGTRLSNTSSQPVLSSSSFNDFSNLLKSEMFFSQIQHHRKKTISEPRNPIAWVELSRLYVISGMKQKAINAMTVACQLAPNNRYVVRSAVRLFLHFGHKGKAESVLKKVKNLKEDPWLLASEITLSTIIDKPSKNIKHSLELVESKKFHPSQISELASSLATLEFVNDKVKSSKKLFKTSLISPNDNTLAQAEWANTKNLNIDIQAPDVNSFAYNTYEAAAIEKFEKEDWDGALANTQNWLIDLPYSKRPILMGSYITTILTKDYKLAEEICQLGIKINPQSPDIINNYSYLLAIQDKVEEALLQFSRIKFLDENDLNEVDKISLQATYGLICYRMGKHETGREIYETALSYARKLQLENTHNICLLNFLREEVRIKSEKAHELKQRAEVSLKNETSVDTLFFQREVFRLYEGMAKET